MSCCPGGEARRLGFPARRPFIPVAESLPREHASAQPHPAPPRGDGARGTLAAPPPRAQPSSRLRMAPRTARVGTPRPRRWGEPLVPRTHTAGWRKLEGLVRGSRVGKYPGPFTPPERNSGGYPRDGEIPGSAQPRAALQLIAKKTVFPGTQQDPPISAEVQAVTVDPSFTPQEMT
ncbi:hypothetical protein AB1E18_019596 [Capra hircus]